MGNSAAFEYVGQRGPFPAPSVWIRREMTAPAKTSWKSQEANGACRDCTRRAAAAALAEPRSPHRSSLLVSSRRAAPDVQPLFEPRRQKFAIGDSNALEFEKFMLNQKNECSKN